MGENKFEICKVHELLDFLKQDGKDFRNFDNQLKHSGAFVYYLKSGNVLLLPNSLSDLEQGINFYDRHTFEQCLKEDHFPIENDDPSVDEKFQNEITNLNTQIPQVVEYLKETFNIVESDYIEILKRINLNTNQREVLKKKMYASFLLGEVIRKTVSGNWILLKQHGTFNPYFLPAILNKKHQVILLSPMSGLFFSDLEFAIDNFLKTPFITQPKLALNSPYFKNLYPEYIILE